MNFYLKTRSTDVDYNWININSNSRQSEPIYNLSDSEFQKKVSDFEKISFWAESSLNKKLFLCFCGIPTNRKDKFNRPIRADIVVETQKEKNQNNEKLLNIIKTFIDLIRNDTKETLPDIIRNNFLSDLINKSLRKEDIDAYFLLTKEIKKLNKINPSDKRIGEYKEKLSKINITISEEDFLTSAEYKDNKLNNYSALDNHSHYFGDITDDKSYYQFLKSIEEMLFGTKNYKIVAICNNKSDKNELADILKLEKEQSVLLGKFDNFNHNGMIPVEIEAKKKSCGYPGKDVKTVQDTKLCSKPSNRNSGVQPSISLGQPIDSDFSNYCNINPINGNTQKIEDNNDSFDSIKEGITNKLEGIIDKVKGNGFIKPGYKLYDKISGKVQRNFSKNKVSSNKENIGQDIKGSDESILNTNQDPAPNQDDES